MLYAGERGIATAIQRPEGLSISIPRDAWGKPLTMTRDGVTRTFNYDANERLNGITDPETGLTSFTLDAANNITTRKVGGQTTGYSYNSRNWLTLINYDGAGDDVTIDYFADGMVKDKENNRSKISYGYNNRRLLTSETHQLKPTLGTYEFDYDYDIRGGNSQITYPDNSTVSFAPNLFGEATQAGSFATGITRFNNGAIDTFNYGNGKSRDVNLNSRFLPSSITDTGVFSVNYAYDRNGNPTTVNSTNQNLTLGYDGLDRLKTVGGVNAFTYDLQDNLKSTSFAGVQTTINYSGQLVTSVVRGGVTQAVSYDTRGNIIQRGNVNFNFNEADQVAAIINKNGYPNNPSFWSIAQHGYDPTGHRVVSQSGCSSTHNLYGASGKLLWQAYDVPVAFAVAPGGVAKGLVRPKSCQASPKLRKYVYLDGQVLAEVETNADNSTKITYRHNDALGSSRATTDAAGFQVNSVNYGPYGEPVPGTQVRGTGYTGHQMDDDDVTYMGARYYDQMMGRFLSIDPVGVYTNSGGNWNRYAYAGNSPYKFVDPDGRASTPMLDEKLLKQLVGNTMGGLADRLINGEGATSRNSDIIANLALDAGKAPAKAVQRAVPDYVSGDANIYVLAGSAQITQYGDVFGGGGVNRSYPNPVSFGVSVSFGYMTSTEGEPSRDQLNGFLSGEAAGVSAYDGLGGGVVTNSSGTAVLIGIGSPGVSTTGEKSLKLTEDED